MLSEKLTPEIILLVKNKRNITLLMLSFIFGLLSEPFIFNSFIHLPIMQNILAINLFNVLYNIFLMLLGVSFIFNKITFDKVKKYMMHMGLYSIVYMLIAFILNFILVVFISFLPLSNIMKGGIIVLCFSITSTLLLYFSGINIKNKEYELLNDEGFFKSFKAILKVFKPIKEINIKILFFTMVIGCFFVINLFINFIVSQVIPNMRFDLFFLLSVKELLGILTFFFFNYLIFGDKHVYR